MEHGLVACTIGTKNYLAHVRVLTESFLMHHANGKVFFLLADDIDGSFDPASEDFILVRLSELGIKNLDTLKFKYTALEFCCALKPFLIDYLFKTHGFTKVVYLDCDIFVLRSCEQLDQLLDRHLLVLTPHLTEPIGVGGERIDELQISLAGVFNGGVIAIANTEEAQSLLSWLKDRLSNYCVFDPPNGLNVDQRWLELAIGFFDNICILRDTTYNVAYWNISSRRIELVGNTYLVDGKPMCLFHFSGFERENPDIERRTVAAVPQIELLVKSYFAALMRHDYQRVRDWPWKYDYFDNGVKISSLSRRIYRENTELQVRYPNPFATMAGDSYYRYYRNTLARRRLRLVLSMPALLLRAFTRAFRE